MQFILSQLSRCFTDIGTDIFEDISNTDNYIFLHQGFIFPTLIGAGHFTITYYHIIFQLNTGFQPENNKIDFENFENIKNVTGPFKRRVARDG